LPAACAGFRLNCRSPDLGCGLFAGTCVFVLADLLVAFLVVAIPPGLFILSLVGLLAR
jgi:hypothetical protein